MIAIDKLWTKLEPMPENISSIKNDLCYGLAPNVPPREYLSGKDSRRYV